MAAKEKKSTVTKHLKDSHGEKEKAPETPKGKRGRKSNAPNDNKASEQKSPVGRKKRKENAQDGRSTPVQKRARRSVVDQEEPGIAKTPPPSVGQKFKKTHLERELGDLLENATGRNTPLLPRNKKINEKEEEGGDGADEKGGLYLSKTRKVNEKDADDDNVSVKSFSTLLRTRKNADKEEDDVASVRSVNLKSKKVEPAEEESSSLRSLLRPNLVTKVGRKKKSVLKAIAVKKKIFIRRGRPKKTKEMTDPKGKHFEEKRGVGRIKVMDKGATESKQKRVIKKPLKFQSKIKDQTRLRSSMAMKNQKLKKTKLKLSEKRQGSKQKGEAEIPKEVDSRERLRTDGQSLNPAKSDGSNPAEVESDSSARKKKSPGMRRRKVRGEGRNEEPETDAGEKSNDVYFFSDGDPANAEESAGGGRSGRMVRQAHQQKGSKTGSKKNPEGRKHRRESGIHFETTRSPDDSSVMIVHPRLGPKIKGSKRLKPILPKAEETGKRTRNAMTQDLVPANLIPNSLTASVSNFSQLSSSYFSVQSMPNFNLFPGNSPIIRSYNSAKCSVNPNFDSNLAVTSTELPYPEDKDFPVSAYGSKVSSNEIIVTPSGIVLSGSRMVSSGGQQHSSSACFNGSETSNGGEDLVFSPTAAESMNGVQPSGLIYQSSTTTTTAIIQPPCPNANTTIFLKRPEAMSTSLISATTGAVLINPNANSNGSLRVNKSHSGCDDSTDSIASEKALEGDFQASGETTMTNRFSNLSKIDFIPSIPVAKNVSDLLLLKSKSILESRLLTREKELIKAGCSKQLMGKSSTGLPNILRETNSLAIDDRKKFGKSERKSPKRTLRNVRHFIGSGSELTFSEPESSNCENEDGKLYRAVSCERISKCSRVLSRETSPKILLQLGSEPVTLSDSLGPFETASILLVTRKEKLEEKLERDGLEGFGNSPKVKEAVEVCRFSKGNEEALKELGLDSDLEQTKSEVDAYSPIKSGSRMEEDGSRWDGEKSAVKEEMSNVLKEMPIRKISNFCRRGGDGFGLSPNSRMDVKNLLVMKNSDYLTSVSPTNKPPTVIDKLLERNKSLKKAEEEGKYGNSMDNYEVVEVKPRRNLRELRTRKFVKGVESRRSAGKKFVHGTSGCKIYERRGSNPEMYSNNYLTVKNEVANENVPLRRITDPGDGKYQRRGSIDYESIQKMLDRRVSLSSADSADPKLSSKSLDEVSEIKTENVRTILVGSSKPLASKNRGSEVGPRVINIVTSNCGLKKGKNLMEEIGLDMTGTKKEEEEEEVQQQRRKQVEDEEEEEEEEEEGGRRGGKRYVNGDKTGRRISLESSNSEMENLHKLLYGLSEANADDKMSGEVPYFGERGEKTRLSPAGPGKTHEEKEKKNVVIEESPEDLVTKETILSALGLQSLKAAAESAQKKKESQSHSNLCQADNGGYTGTLKAVIKIQRQEKKGNSKSPIKMVYKASSSSSSVSGQLEDSNNFDEGEATSREDAEESTSEDNKNGTGKAKSLVIPEKASSFSIHPGRMCSDVCTYCFGKFGLLDTPCHIAQLKDADKRRNILATEVHLTADSCLCDACFRHVDKKSNCPTFTEKKNDIRRRSVRKQTCIVQNCNADSQHSIRRKLFLKLKKSIGRKVVLDASKLEKLQPGQSLTFCNRHIYWIDYFMSCGICKKRLTSVNMYRVTSEVLELNAALSSDEIPAILTENRFLCKICNCFASIRIKCKNPTEMSSSHRQFYETCRKRILKCHGMDVPDSEPEGETKNQNCEGKSLRRTKRSSKPTATVTANENSKSDNEVEAEDQGDKGNRREKDLKKVSHLNLPPTKANGNLDFGGVSISPAATEVNPTQIHVKLGNLNIGALGNLNIGQEIRHGTRSGEVQCFPTEAELSLRAHFDLKPSAEDESAKSARKGFEKCTTTIQFSAETKNLFYNLQMPYGNQSSFFRHLILLEKYFRSGDLVISKNADPKAVNYISSVQNRIRSYEGVHQNPSRKPQEIPPSLSILPQPVKTELRNSQEVNPSVMPSRPFTLTPMMPSNSSNSSSSSSYYLKNSPLSQIQATVQNIQPAVPKQSQGIMTSLLKSSLQSSSSSSSSSKFANHPKPEVSITSVTGDSSPPVRVGHLGSGKASVLTSKIQENLRNLASRSQMKQPNQARAVILNRTVGGQKQSLVQVTTGGKTIHLTLSQFRRIQQMQMKKKQYLDLQGKMLKGKEKGMGKEGGGGGGGGSSGKAKAASAEDNFNLKNLSPELEIQEVKQQQANGNELLFPLISEVRSLAGEEATNWDGKSDSNEGSSCDSFPKIPKALSVSVTKIPPPPPPLDYSVKEQSVDSVD